MKRYTDPPPLLRKLVAAERLQLLRCLRASCCQGRTGIWDSGSDEGRESFQPMIDDLDRLIHSDKLQLWADERKRKRQTK